MGFIPDIEFICEKLPANRQTLLFSATMPGPIKKLSDRFLSNPKYIEVARPATANVNIEQFKVKTSSRDKRETLVDLLRGDDVTSALIFANRKTTVRELNKSLKRAGFSTGEIHGDMDQGSRIAELDRFKKGEINILVASDVAARGLDIKGVSHVFNYDTPWHPDDYVHRIGRTGRAGAKGKAFTMVTPEDAEAIGNVEKLTGMDIPVFAMGEGDADDLPRPEKKTRRDDGRARREKPRSEAPAREERQAPEPRRNEPRRPEPRQAEPVDEDSGEWNGPVPEFLATSALA
jgi:superfamily II DNA/RNA helicase